MRCSIDQFMRAMVVKNAGWSTRVYKKVVLGLSGIVHLLVCSDDIHLSKVNSVKSPRVIDAVRHQGKKCPQTRIA